MKYLFTLPVCDSKLRILSKKHRYLIVWQCLFFIPIRLNINAINRFNHSLDLWILMFQIRLVQTIFSIESEVCFDIIRYQHFSLHINELNTVENSYQESNPVPTSILILAGRGSLQRCSGSFGSSRIYFRLITSGSVNSHSPTWPTLPSHWCQLTGLWL